MDGGGLRRYSCGNRARREVHGPYPIRTRENTFLYEKANEDSSDLHANGEEKDKDKEEEENREKRRRRIWNLTTYAGLATR